MKFASLLSIAADAKTSKGEKLGFTTGILYLAPAKQSGYQTCPMAKLAQCESACLYSAGLGGVYPSVPAARIAKTRQFFEDRTVFMARLVWSIQSLIRKATQLGNIPLVRLNGTSDIRFESVRLVHEGVEYPNIMAVFPDVQFYDYTKDAPRFGRALPSNYDLTFSYSGVSSYAAQVEKARSYGARMAAVFRKREDIPESFKGMRTIDGDDTDVRHIEPQGVIVALYAKGQAKTDKTGFVVDRPIMRASAVRKVIMMQKA